MARVRIRCLSVTLIGVLSLCAFPALAAGPAPKAAACDDQGKIYPVCSDQTKVLRSGLARAKVEKKLLVAVVGAEWCPWCVSLHRLLDDPAFRAAEGEGFASVDLALYEGKEKLPSGVKALEELKRMAGVKTDFKGIPLLAVVNPRTKRATFIETEPLEQNTEKTKGHDPAKVKAALVQAAAALR